MPLHFVKSRKGNDLLNHDGFVYNHLRKNKSNFVWECVKRKELHCKGLAYTTTNDCLGTINNY